MKKKKAGLMLVVLIMILVTTASRGGKVMGNKIARLCEAIAKGDNERAIEIAEGVRDLNAQSSRVPWLVEFLEAEVTTPLVKACETENAEMIVWLLEHGARTDYAPGRIAYPLETFCESGTGAGIDALQKLLECGANPNQYKYSPPLFCLAKTLLHRSDETFPTGVKMVLMLLDYSPAWQDPTDGSSILHYAAMQRNADLLKALLGREEAAAFLNAENDEGRTPLDLAEQQENAECIQILRGAGALRGE